ncbi:MAG TPA: matrixin family metalloprotease [Thermoanaerobaculia bacterium]|jgi:hypothetical protein
MTRRLPVIFLVLLSVTPLTAATRMTYYINGTPTPIEWEKAAFPLRYEIETRVAESNPNATTFIERAFSAWESIAEADVQFQAGGVVRTVAPQTPNRVSISMADDLLSGQGAAAVTSYTYDTKTGRMLDADITIDKALFDGNVNAQFALQHEIGHVLGLDHSAVLSSIMYPYVADNSDPTTFEQDDRIGIAGIYPKGDQTLNGATLAGRVMGDQGGIFAAQVVALNEEGQPVGTTLTNASGEFTLSGIPAGRYRLYAEPLDGPVDTLALQGTWRQSSTPFPTRFFGMTVEVENGEVYGNLMLNTAGPVQLNPRWIGVSEPNAHDMGLATSSATVRPGQTIQISVAGDGFTSGMTKFEVTNPAFRRVSDYGWMSNCVHATYVVDPSAKTSSAVVVVTNGNDTATLTGALRVFSPGGRSRAVRR